MTNSLKYRIVIALLLLGGGVYLHQHPAAADSIVAAVRAPLSIFGVKGTVVQAWIVEETSTRSKLPQSQIIAIRKAETLGIKLVDPGDDPTTEAAKAELAAVLKAAQGKPMPLLVRKWSNGRTTAIALPATFEELKGAM